MCEYPIQLITANCLMFSLVLISWYNLLKLCSLHSLFFCHRANNLTNETRPLPSWNYFLCLLLLIFLLKQKSFLDKKKFCWQKRHRICTTAWEREIVHWIKFELQGLCPDTEIVCGINVNVWSFITHIRLNRGSRLLALTRPRITRYYPQQLSWITLITFIKWT